MEMMGMGTKRVVGLTDFTTHPTYYYDVFSSVRIPVPAGTQQKCSCSSNFQHYQTAHTKFTRTTLPCQLQHRNPGSRNGAPCSMLKTHTANTRGFQHRKHSTACRLRIFCEEQNTTTAQQLTQFQLGTNQSSQSLNAPQ